MTNDDAAWLRHTAKRMANELAGSEYIGDGVYVSFDGFQVWLRTSNGMEITNMIALPPEQIRNLNKYIKSLEETKDES